MLFAGVTRPPPHQKILNDLHFSACFETYYRAVLVKYSSYLVLSLVELGVAKITKNFPKDLEIFIKALIVEVLLP